LRLQQPVPGLVPVRFRAAPARRGEWIIAVGQPLGLGHTVTAGVVSGLGRDHADLLSPSALRPDGVWSFIQTDASINIGNSGGPLLDRDGEVVGITTAVRRDGQGLAFAIPAAMATRFIDEVRTHGRLRHPRLGIRAENVPAGTVPGRGPAVRITQVDEDGPGAKAGLRVGEVLLSVGGQPVRRVGEVAYLAQLTGVGSELALVVHADDAVREFVIVPDLAP
jgi:S1-C subfamily serine protease